LVATRPHVEHPIVLGNTLEDILKPLKTHWEVKETLWNMMGTSWEHQNLKNSKPLRNRTIFKKKPRLTLGPKVETKSSYRGCTQWTQNHWSKKFNQVSDLMGFNF
jgi:hypothetical protein